MSLIHIVILVAATHRLTRLVVDDEITRPFREKVTERWPGSRMAYWVTCPYCVSVEAAILVLVVPDPVNWVLALSAAVIAVNRLTELLEAAVHGRRD